jgi:hypothetical protein
MEDCFKREKAQRPSKLTGHLFSPRRVNTEVERN